MALNLELVTAGGLQQFVRIIIFYIIFGISKSVPCYALTGLFLIFLGVLMIILQPYKSEKLNIYHTTPLFIMAVACLSITVLNVAEIKAPCFIKTEIMLIGILFMSPTLVAMAYVTYRLTYRCRKKCPKVCLMFTESLQV